MLEAWEKSYELTNMVAKEMFVVYSIFVSLHIKGHLWEVVILQQLIPYSTDLSYHWPPFLCCPLTTLTPYPDDLSLQWPLTPLNSHSTDLFLRWPVTWLIPLLCWLFAPLTLILPISHLTDPWLCWLFTPLIPDSSNSSFFLIPHSAW